MFVHHENIGNDLYLVSLADVQCDTLGGWLLYAPLRKRALRLTDGEVRRLRNGELEDLLVYHGFNNKCSEPAKVEPKPFDFFDHNHLYIGNTSGCNLRCDYCYADGGEHHDVMSWEVYSALRDYLPGMARRNGNRLSVSFHGDGETLTQEELCFKICEDLQALAAFHKFQLHTSMTTNCTLITEKNVDSIVKSFGHLSISFDGDPEAQNRNRPLASGKGSMAAFMRGINLLHSRKFNNFGIRSTITSESVHRMPEMVDFIVNVLGCKKMHMEPATACNRVGEDITVSADNFVKYFRLARERARFYGASLYTSNDKPDTISRVFCGVTKAGITLLPNGSITACSRVTHSDDPFFAKYGYAKYNPKTKRFDINQETVDALAHTTVVDAYPECANCYAKWHCNGVCSASRDRGSAPLLCEITQRLTLDSIMERFLRKHFLNQREELQRVRNTLATYGTASVPSYKPEEIAKSDEHPCMVNECSAKGCSGCSSNRKPVTE